MRQTITAAIVAALVAAIVSASAALGAGAWITGRDVRDGTLTGRDLRASSIALDRLGAGVRRRLAQTPTSTPVVAVPTGPHTSIATAEIALPADGTHATKGVECPAGMVVLGGGAQTGDAFSRPDVLRPAPDDPGSPAVYARPVLETSAPTPEGRAWTATAHADEPGQMLVVYAICARGD